MDYFKHDINASEDDKICDLLAIEGYELLGYYWRFIEYLYSRGGKVYKEKLHSIAWSLHMDVDKLSRLICNYGLFYEDGEYICSKRVIAGLAEFEASYNRMVELGRAGGKASAKAKAQANAQANGQPYAQADGKRTVKRTVSDSSSEGQADAQLNRINKINKIKENNNSALSGESPDGEDELTIDFPLSKSDVPF